MADARKIPAPVVTVETQPFWNAARERPLRRPRRAPPAARRTGIRAPSARSAAATRSNGARRRAGAQIYSYSVMRRAKEPYAIAYVTLAEGPAMLTNIVECDFDALRVGQPVSVVFNDSEDGPPVPMFKPA